jgi:myo-inositol-1(or 4)-monophosphatase
MWSDSHVGVAERTLCETAVLVATEAAEVANAARRSAVTQVDTKSSETDMVTSGDRATERHIRAMLAELRPGEPMLGEEEGGADSSAPVDGVCWVVDPIDGTVNYVYGFPWYAVSVAAQVDGVSVAGAVVEPASGRCWSAALGHGAELVTGTERVQLAVSNTRRLALAMVATGFAYQARRRVRQAAVMSRLVGTVRDLRRTGSAALDLCSVAAGWLDAYVEHGLSRWDWAAGALIAEEAGAVVRLPASAVSDRVGVGHTDDGLGDDALFVATPGVADSLLAQLIDCGIGEV